MTNKRIIAINTIFSIALQVITIICGFILPRLLLQYYGSEVNGLVSSISQFLSAVSVMDLGIGSVVKYNFYKPLAEKNAESLSCVYFASQRYFRTIAVVLIGYVFVLTIVYPRVISNQFEIAFSIWLIIIISISSFSQFFWGQTNQLLLLADEKGFITNGIQILTLIINTIVSVILVNNGMSIHAVKLSTAIVYSARPIILACYVRKKYCIKHVCNRNEIALDQKWNGVAQHISSFVLDQTDIIVLTIFSSLKNVSIYSIYNMVLYGVKTLMISSTSGIEAYFGKLLAVGDENGFRDVFEKVEWGIHVVSTLIFSCVIVLIRPFVMVYTRGVYDTNYNVPIFAFLISFANAIHCFRLPYSIAVLSGGHYRKTHYIYIISAVSNITISVILVRSAGIIGVAIGTIIAMTLQTIWLAWYSSSRIVGREMSKVGKLFAADIVTGVITYTLSRTLSMKTLTYSSWIVLAFKTVVICIIVVMSVNMLAFRKMIVEVLQSFHSGCKRTGK